MAIECRFFFIEASPPPIEILGQNVQSGGETSRGGNGFRAIRQGTNFGVSTDRFRWLHKQARLGVEATRR